MKTLIWNGSPRKNGDTAFLVHELARQLRGDVKILDVYSRGIAPCVDCRYCCREPGCAQKDGMQSVYREIAACDAVVIASPIYFSELTGPLLSAASRLQMFYAARRFLHCELLPKKKKGAIILCGGGDGSAEIAKTTAETLLAEMNAECVGFVASLNTDAISSRSDAQARRGIREMAALLNAEHGGAQENG